ncbi:MAG: oligosaccharide flippase family protein [Bacteroidota bacterium]
MRRASGDYGLAATLFARIAGDRVRALSLLEQGMISGANFLALLLLARGFDTDHFGTFSFAWLTLLFVINIQRSAVVVPFVIHTAQPGVLAAEAPAWRRLSLWTTALSVSALGLIAAALPFFAAPDWMATAFVLAALFVAPSFTYEFRRRWLIQLDHFGATVAAAATYAVLYVGGIALAVAGHRLELAAAAFIVANGGAAILCTVLAPRLPKPAEPPKFIPFLRNLAHFIGWSVASNLAYNGYSHLPPLILGALAGPGPVALFQAMRNFTQPLSTAATAIDNFDKPRAARALAAEGIGGLRRALTHTTTAMALMTLPYVVLLVLFGAQLVDLVYGPRYGDPTVTLAWFGAVHVAVIFVYPLETSLFLLRRPDLLFRGRVFSALIGVGLCGALVPRWGLGGAMAGITAGLIFSGLAALTLLLREKPWKTP